MPTTGVEKLFKCPDCGSNIRTEDLIYPIPDVSEKVLPGEAMPQGECPECGGLIPHDAGEGDRADDQD